MLIGCPLLGGRAEAAITCTLTGPTLTFGTINIFSMQGVVSFPVSGSASGSGSYTFPLVITIPAPSPLPPPGTYSSTFTGTDLQVYWNQASQPTCSALASAGGSTHTSSSTLSASAVVANQCSVSASNMNFGSASLLSSALSATGQISVSCNASLPVTIALDNGATGTGPTNRLMTAGGNSIQYGIYKDSAHNQPWGNSVGTNTASGTGSKFRCVAGRSAAGGCSAS